MKGRINLASAARNAMCKALEQSAAVGAGRWGERGRRERREGGGEHRQVHTSTNKAQQDTNNTREGKRILQGGIGDPKVVGGRSPDIFQGGVGGLYIQ